MFAVCALICKNKQVLSAPAIKILSIIDISTVSVISTVWNFSRISLLLVHKPRIVFTKTTDDLRKGPSINDVTPEGEGGDPQKVTRGDKGRDPILGRGDITPKLLQRQYF